MAPTDVSSALVPYRAKIEQMLDSGTSFADIEALIAEAQLSEEPRAELWQFARQAWSQRLREARAPGDRVKGPARRFRVRARRR